ncbi:amidohydrolase [Blastopirellula sp. JC732]|uniref:Amidohydrolase n=1 Tax=Blastopirellula sediminis TaxID=2894196 RepID=A0A9X1SFG8_9BACT|nr:amidohydrolase family protein [Blastopirellula sediminis]MCC9608935.1 amidohydrolase [Blastopirellula sediminis]MCC9628288.1 amidohydrolase [Blastopirellula sediminis]
MSQSSGQPLLSRRHLLQAGAAVAASASLGLAKEEKKPGYIDAHVHIWTPDTSAYPLGKHYDKSAMKPASFTPDELFAYSRPEGVDRIVLIQMSFYETDNKYMLDAIEKYPDTFRGVAIIDHEAPGVLETMRGLKEQGVNGYRLYADAKSTASWVDSPEMATMWKGAAETGQAICLLSNPDALPSIEKLCKKFPETTVVIDHFSRIGVSGTIQGSDLDNLCKLATFPKTHVKTSAFYALGKKKPPYLDLGPMIRRLRDTFGADRLMWASDCPYQVEKGNTYAASIALIRDKLDFLTDVDKEWMLRKTAEKVLWS